jgi:hypothetical protein
MKKQVTITIEVDTDAPSRKSVTGFRAEFDDVDFTAGSVPFSVQDASTMQALALRLALSSKGE